MKLKMPPPADRTAEQLRHHYEVEKAIATRLKSADRVARTQIYRSMYDELFSVVPDHPRLTRRDDASRCAEANSAKLKLFGRFVKPASVVLEFGPGDCRFAYALCGRAKFVYGVDISDQSGSTGDAPENFKLIVYDGYALDLAPGTANVVLSDQLIEHFHPEDTEHHFQTVHHVLTNGGHYVFRTPHRFNGPHDVSKYFCDEPEGFHLKEWTYGELGDVLKRIGYGSCWGYVAVKSKLIPFPLFAFRLIEGALRLLPRRPRRLAARIFLRDIFLAARKKL